MSEIVHTATITEIKKNKITATFERGEACGSCALKEACGHAKNNHEIIVGVKDIKPYSIGQKIEVVMSGSQAFYAAFWGYILPLITVLAALAVTYAITADETTGAYVSLASLAVYYVVLFVLRKHFQKSLQIKIR